LFVALSWCKQVGKLRIATLQGRYMKRAKKWAPVPNGPFHWQLQGALDVDEGANAEAFCPAADQHGFQGVIARLDLDQTPQNDP
jgi:hypothetical protein